MIMIIDKTLPAASTPVLRPAPRCARFVAVFLVALVLPWIWKGQPASAATSNVAISISPPTIAAVPPSKSGLADLHSILGRITGREVTDTTDPRAATVSLYLTSAPDAPPTAVRRLAEKGIDPFVISGDDHRVEIVANDPHGLDNGIAFYLEQLGVRWLLPNPRWTVIPHRSDIGLTIDRLVEPAFKVRSYAGTGGFYSWKWGRKFQGSALLEQDTIDWERRLRYGGEYTLGKSVGEGFIADKSIVPVLAQHPDYLAEVDGQPSPLYIEDRAGKRVLNITAKVNAGSPPAVDLFCDWVLAQFRIARQSPDRSRHDVTSVEPSDGYGYGTNVKDLPGNGSGSDQSFFIANACARRVRALDPKASVILLAYAGHADPPSFDLEPNVIVQVTPYAFQTRPPEQFMTDWARKARRLAIYDYWSIPDWSSDEPTFDVKGLSARLLDWRSHKIEAVNAETTYGAGAMGLGHYLAAHLMWDPHLDEKGLEDDWFEAAFGAAKGPMRQMFGRWGKDFTLDSAEVGASFRDLSAAERLAAGDPEVVARIDDLVRYVQYLRLRLELVNRSGKDEANAKVLELVAHLLSSDSSHMMHTTRLIDLLNRKYPGIYTAFDIAQQSDPSSGWGAVHELDHQGIAALLAEGMRAYPAPDFVTRRFVGPDTRIAAQPSVPSQDGPAPPSLALVGNLSLRFVVSDGVKTSRFRFSRGVDLDITVTDQAGNVVGTEHVPGGGKEAASQMVDVDFRLPPGQYGMRVSPAGGRASGYFTFEPSSTVPLALETFLPPKPTPSPRLFFYAPKGLNKLAISMPNSDYGGVFKLQVFDPTGRAATVERRDNGRLLVATVPPGQDGAVWSLQRVVAPDTPIRLLNAPQAFALTRQALVVPADALPSR